MSATDSWRHLGALAFLAFVVCAATGIYLYVAFDTSLEGAYASGRALDGSFLRGLHRYSADAFAVATLLHLAREAWRRHFRWHRAWSWLSGLALLPLAWLAGLTGYWLAWDERARTSLALTADWLAPVNDRFFSLLVFVHIGVPLIALAVTWAHLQRLSYVRAWPPLELALPAVAALAVLALAWPAMSTAAADPFTVPASVTLDWFYLAPDAWAGVAALAVAGAVLPLLARGGRPGAAVVNLANCNGCGRCVADCPFAAVVMAPRSDGRRARTEARVTPDLCAACGICAGACPTEGIDLPRHTVRALRAEVDRWIERRPGAPLVFACAPGGYAGEAIRVECAAMVPPPLARYAVRRGAGEVRIAGCRDGDCEHRLGDRWLRERIAGLRRPALRHAKELRHG